MNRPLIPIALIGIAALSSFPLLQFKGKDVPEKFLYKYLTDFILTLSHSHIDVNALIFIIMMPRRKRLQTQLPR